MPKTKEPTPEVEDIPTELVGDDGVELVEIPYNGVVFVVPKQRDDWSTEALAYVSEGRYNLFVKYMLEFAKSGQWDMLCALCPRRRDFAGFFAVFGKALEQECVG